MKTIITLLLFTLLIGCTGLVRDATGIDLRSQDEIFKHHRETCTQIGFETDTTEFIQCVFELEKVRLGQMIKARDMRKLKSRIATKIKNDQRTILD